MRRIRWIDLLIMASHEDYKAVGKESQMQKKKVRLNGEFIVLSRGKRRRF